MNQNVISVFVDRDIESLFDALVDKHGTTADNLFSFLVIHASILAFSHDEFSKLCCNNALEVKI